MTASRRAVRARCDRAIRILAIVGLVIGLAACQSDGSGGGTDVAAGQQAFETHCIACHGPEAQGTDQGPPLVHIVYEHSHHSDDAFRTAAREGVVPHHWDFGPMPPVAGISEEEMEAVITYVRDLQRKAGIQ